MEFIKEVSVAQMNRSSYRMQGFVWMIFNLKKVRQVFINNFFIWNWFWNTKCHFRKWIWRATQLS